MSPSFVISLHCKGFGAARYVSELKAVFKAWADLWLPISACRLESVPLAYSFSSSSL